MKIVLLNTYETKGGAAIACKRLMEALRKDGIEVKMLVQYKSSNHPDVVSVGTSRFSRVLNKLMFVFERLLIFLANRCSKDQLFAVSTASTGIDISKNKYIQDADIIHLHWINQGFLSLKNIQQLQQLSKPIIWTMHDMWPATGICHHARTCTKYQNNCHHCVFLKYPSKNDLSKQTFDAKMELYQTKINFIACSKWLTLLAQKSELLQKCTVQAIPNPINIEQFKKEDRTTSCLSINLPTHKKLILFAAPKLSDARKGINYLIKALEIIKENMPELAGDIEIVLVGDAGLEMVELIPFPCHHQGYVSDISKLVQIYNACDIFVTPSLEDNLPNTIMEAMACGTPCVGFNIGGIPELIDHKINGYIANYKSSQSFADGICWCLNYSDNESLSKETIDKVHKNYAEAIISRQYINTYKTILIKK